MFVCVCGGGVSIYTHMYAGDLEGQKRTSHPMELKLWRAVIAMWVLKLGLLKEL